MKLINNKKWFSGLKLNSLKIKVLFYLLIFSIAILLFLWIFQVVSLDSYYQSSVKKEIAKVTSSVKKNYNDANFQEIFNILSHEEDMCIEIYDTTSLMFSSIKCNNYAIDADLMRYKQSFARSGKEENSYTVKNDRFNTKTLLYAIKFEDGNFAFVNVPLEPVDATVKILEKQFIYVAIIVFGISVLAAYFISRRISKPIENINKSAKKLAEGNYAEHFEAIGNIDEINYLAATLNYTSAELGKTEDLRREFLANVSHDLKTPLTMIKAYAEMVKDLTYKDKKKREDNLDTIINETDRLNLLVNDILDLSRFQAGIYDLQYEDIDLNKLIKNIINNYDIYALKDGYKIEYEEVKDIIIIADRKRIEQVIYNLINNAINYTGEDKKVIVKVIDKEDSIRVEITDTGKGIKEEELNLIWDKYYKADKSYGRKELGTGIGLSIVKTVLSTHNFNYGVISKKNKGTTFYFEADKKNR